jgi:hypothetical protein
MGTHGSISIKKRPGGSVYIARCRFRDFDGVARSLERHGRSKAAAAVALQDEIRTRTGAPAAPLRPHHTFERAAELWLAKLDARVAGGARAASAPALSWRVLALSGATSVRPRRSCMLSGSLGVVGGQEGELPQESVTGCRDLRGARLAPNEDGIRSGGHVARAP